MRASDIQQLLPEVYRRTAREGGVLSAMLEAMDALHAPAERRLDTFDTALDPRRAEPAFVTYLAGWLDLEDLFDVPQDRPAKGNGNGNDPVNAAVFPAGLGRLRELVAAAASLGRRRGDGRGAAAVPGNRHGLGRLHAGGRRPRRRRPAPPVPRPRSLSARGAGIPHADRPHRPPGEAGLRDLRVGV